LRREIFVQHRILSAVTRVEFVSAGMSYIALRVRWCNIIVLNVPAPTKGKCGESKDRIYEELEHTFDHFPKYHMKILYGDFNATMGREDVFKPTIGNRSLLQESSNNYVRIINFVTS